MACKHGDAAHDALLDLIIQLRVDMEEMKEALMEHDVRLDDHDEDLDVLMAEDEVFESEDEDE